MGCTFECCTQLLNVVRNYFCTQLALVFWMCHVIFIYAMQPPSADPRRLPPHQPYTAYPPAYPSSMQPPAPAASVYSSSSYHTQQYPQHPSYAAPMQPTASHNYAYPQHHPYITTANKRHSGIRQVQLTAGNLVVDAPVPDRLLEKAVYKQGNEFTTLRYTACTSDPDDFVKEQYTLRPAIYQRQTEIFIVLTMYNEDEALFCRTYHSVMKNIAHLCSRNRSKIWGKDAWKRVVVCIVSDGRAKIHPRTLQVLGAIGAYQDGLPKNSVMGKEVKAHLFEFTTQVTCDRDLRIRGADEGVVPVQVLFCLKEKNAKKINSHRWFFNAFSHILRPNVCILLDVGTKPSNTSIYHLWKAFDRDPQVGGACGDVGMVLGISVIMGACGEICADLGKAGSLLINPLVATQNFEYKMSNILDKPLESVFGYISVLPGAFSAYRYQALQNVAHDEGPLHSYFKGETMHGDNATGGIFEANMYLAEDRILCFELIAKRNANWVLRYVKSAKAWTDVPDNLPEFISQRRRWLNGSFFAAFYAIFHFFRIFKSNHSVLRLFLFFVEFFYNTVQMLFSWFSLGNFYLTFYFLTVAYQAKSNPNYDPTRDPFYGYGDWVFNIARELYLFVIVVIFVISLGNRPAGSKWTYLFAVILFSMIMMVMLYTAGMTVFYSVIFSFFMLTVNTFSSRKPLMSGLKLAIALFTSPLSAILSSVLHRPMACILPRVLFIWSHGIC